jgi:hypothetical protein
MTSERGGCVKKKDDEEREEWENGLTTDAQFERGMLLRPSSKQ